MVNAVSELSERLADAKGDSSIDVIADRASRAGFRLARSTVAKYLRGEHGPNPPDQTLQALAAGLRLEVGELRELAGRQSGQGEFVPDPRSASLTQHQRDLVNQLIVELARKGGQTDAGQAEAEKNRGRRGESGVTQLPSFDEDVHAPQAARRTDRSGDDGQ